MQDERPLIIVARDCAGIRKRDVEISALIGQAVAHRGGSASLNYHCKFSPNDVFIEGLGKRSKSHISLESTSN